LDRSEAGLSSGKKFTLIGTPEGDEIKDPSRKVFNSYLFSVLKSFPEIGLLPDVVNDLDVDFTENLAASNRYQHDTRNIRKVQEMTRNLQVNIIHPLRPGKRLLVLDIDYSGFDRSLSRYTHRLLSSSYLGHQTLDFREPSTR